MKSEEQRFIFERCDGGGGAQMPVKPISVKCVLFSVLRGKCTGANIKLIENENGKWVSGNYAEK